jgi:uncharacterized protein (TIGR02600 family)
VAASSTPGDWDNGTANIKDGAYINKPDDGAMNTGGATYQNAPPYYQFGGTTAIATNTLFSPNRQMPSAVMFGSLPTGVQSNHPWQTLLFHPSPGGNTVNALGTTGHIGAQAPMDHLLLDLFTMPVVEPYAISEPLSTAGRINMNYQILPFTYINRDTGIRAVIKAERMLSIPNGAAGGGVPVNYGAANSGTAQSYKNYYLNGTGGVTYGTITNGNASTGQANSYYGSAPYLPNDLRFDINPDETIKGFQARFQNYASNSTWSASSVSDVFRSPSEICTIDLVPWDLTDSRFPLIPSYGTTGTAPTSYAALHTNMLNYWADHALTGDNSRERPYADIYPRLTTKSNTFTIHMRVQTLQQTKADLGTTTWNEATDVVTGEYRGSEIVERYVDPSNGNIPDYAGSPSVSPTAETQLGTLYKWRVVSTKQFAP